MTRRETIENAITSLIELLDVVDGDPDYEPDPPEQQHDDEAELSWCSGSAPTWFIIAERARRRSSS